MRMNAYHYDFHPTGNDAIDRVLSAVACAGKAFHHTKYWAEWYDYNTPDGHVGDSPVDWIQNAANDAAKLFAGKDEKGLMIGLEKKFL